MKGAILEMTFHQSLGRKDYSLPPDTLHAKSKMKILVVSGFLGAGKTTFIKRLTKRLGGKVCILENEFGGVSIDQAVLQADTGLDIWEVTDECICCSSSNSLEMSIVTILSQISPDWLVVEATGVGLLSNIMTRIRRLEKGGICTGLPVTVVDGANFDRNWQAADETFRDQIRSAGVILMSKCEGLSTDEEARLAVKIRGENACADIAIHSDTGIGEDWWEKLLSTPAEPGRLLTVEESSPWETVTLLDAAPQSLPGLLSFLNALLTGDFGRVSRAKGILLCGDEWIHFELAGDRYTINRFAEQTQSMVVVIGRALERERIAACV